jgi:hypothetical protein
MSRWMRTLSEYKWLMKDGRNAARVQFSSKLVKDVQMFPNKIKMPKQFEKLEGLIDYFNQGYKTEFTYTSGNKEIMPWLWIGPHRLYVVRMEYSILYKADTVINKRIQLWPIKGPGRPGVDDHRTMIMTITK